MENYIDPGGLWLENIKGEPKEAKDFSHIW